MEWVETTGKTIESAKDAALDQLGVDEDDAEFEILEEPKSGLFGRIRQEARVRGRVRPTTPRAKTERRDRGKRNTRATQPRANVPSESSEQPDTNNRPDTNKSGTKKSGKPSNKRQEGAKVETDVTLVEQGEIAKKFVSGLIEAFDIPCSVEVRELEENTLEVVVTGENLGLLVGPRGATLTAVQDLSRTALQHALNGARGARLRVDIAGYWEKRRAALERFAKEVSAQVLETGTSVALEPMDAADRKVVHDTVNEIEGVQTVSDGEDSRRHVVIKPA